MYCREPKERKQRRERTRRGQKWAYTEQSQEDVDPEVGVLSATEVSNES